MTANSPSRTISAIADAGGMGGGDF